MVVLLTYVSLILGELVPKRLALTHPEAIASIIARPMDVLAAVGRPIVTLLSVSTDTILRLFGVRQVKQPAVTHEEIKVLLEQGADEGVFELAEHEMVTDVLNLDDRHVGSVLTPRSDIVFLDVRDSPDVSRQKLRQASHSVLPPCDGGLDHVLGFVRSATVLERLLDEGSLNLPSAAEKALFVPETMSLMMVLEQFKRMHLPAALVIDEFGDAEGLVSLMDVTEWIVGDLPAEPHEEPMIVRPDDGSLLLDGALGLDALQRTLDAQSLLSAFDRQHYHNFGGLAMLALGRVLGRGLLVFILSLGNATGVLAQADPTAASQGIASPERCRAQNRIDRSSEMEATPLSNALLRRTVAGPAQPTCDGCPARRPGVALLETTGVNVLYGMVNLIRGQVTARITPTTWWANMKSGWVWDLDDFVVNQIGHPFQGSNYFNAGRANGLTFYESAGIAAFGSGTWEYFGETNRPSLNDFINTTLGGIALGEMIHRTGWLVRDTRTTGRGRRWREIAAAAIDPLTGFNRLITGDASRVTDKASELVPSSVGGIVSSGVLWRGSTADSSESGAHPFAQIDLLYGDTETGRSRTAYEAFSVRLTAGGGGAITEARVRGRLLGQPLYHDRLQFSIVQNYTFLANSAYRFGAQSFEARLGGTAGPSARSSSALLGWGGVTLLGAVDSRPFEPPAAPLPELEPAGQGVSDQPREYDYGPGWTFGASATWNRDGQAVLAALYEGRTIYSLDGIRANHVLHRVRADVVLPVRNKLGIGVTGEYFGRFSLYQDPRRSRRAYRYPQFRVFLAVGLS